jgi:hypothetical protein
MLKRSFRRAWFAPVLGFAVTLIHPAVANASTSANLLVNGDAELQVCTNDWTVQTSIPGWHVVRGAASVLCYSAFNFAQVTPITPSNVPAGKALFGARSTAAWSDSTFPAGWAAGPTGRNEPR